jgi:hypothetical protein
MIAASRHRTLWRCLSGRFLFALLGTALLAACTPELSFTQDIEINAYPDPAANAALAENLVYYDQRYFVENIEHLDEDSARGIKLGYFVRSSDRQAHFRVTYNLVNPAVLSNLDALKAEFQTLVDKIASQHVALAPRMAELQPVSEGIIRNFFVGDVDSMWQFGARVLTASSSKQVLQDNAALVIREYGQLAGLRYLRAQYYEQLAGQPQLVAMHYQVDTDQQITALANVTYQWQDETWRVAGFRIVPQ